MSLLRSYRIWRRNHANWGRYRKVIDELDRLSDRELAELGILRADIPHIAREAL